MNVSEEGSLHTRGEEQRSASKAPTREQQVKEEAAAERGNPTCKERWYLEIQRGSFEWEPPKQETLLYNTAYPHILLWDGRRETLISDE